MSASLQAVFLQCKHKTDVGADFQKVFLMLQLLPIAGVLKIFDKIRDESGEAKKDRGGECFFHPLLLIFGLPRKLYSKGNM